MCSNVVWDLLFEFEEAFYSKGKYKSPKYASLNNKTKTIKHSPLNKHGQISRCVVCGSKMHWAGKWPHQNKKWTAYLAEGNDSDDDDSSEEINIVYKSEIFVAEASKSAVMDTACTKTVAGEKWFKKYTSNLTEKARKEIWTYPSNASFKFSDGRKVQALKRVVFPLLTAGKHCKIGAEIVVQNIPLLLSKSSLKSAEQSSYEWW